MASITSTEARASSALIKSASSPRIALAEIIKFGFGRPELCRNRYQKRPNLFARNLPIHRSFPSHKDRAMGAINVDVAVQFLINAPGKIDGAHDPAGTSHEYTNRILDRQPLDPFAFHDLHFRERS